jgi:hypothetical protein
MFEKVGYINRLLEIIITSKLIIKYNINKDGTVGVYSSDVIAKCKKYFDEFEFDKMYNDVEIMYNSLTYKSLSFICNEFPIETIESCPTDIQNLIL